MDRLPDEVLDLVLTHVDPHDLAPLLWVSRRLRRLVKAQLRERVWTRLESQLKASLITVESSRARDAYLIRYTCHMHTPCYHLHPPGGRYRCTRCARACHHVGGCRCRPLSTLLRRALLGPFLASALALVALSVPWRRSALAR